MRTHYELEVQEDSSHSRDIPPIRVEADDRDNQFLTFTQQRPDRIFKLKKSELKKILEIETSGMNAS